MVVVLDVVVLDVVVLVVVVLVVVTRGMHCVRAVSHVSCGAAAGAKQFAHAGGQLLVSSSHSRSLVARYRQPFTWHGLAVVLVVVLLVVVLHCVRHGSGVVVVLLVMVT